jgi:hypothetical protein
LVTTYPNTSVNNLEQPTTAESKPLKWNSYAAWKELQN